MKRNVIKTTIILFIAFSLFNCNKVPFDFRNKYIGDWSFEIKASGFNMADSSTFNYTESYDGEVKYGVADDAVIIKYGDNSTESLDFKIDKRGNLSGFPSSYYGSGEFESRKKLSITITGGGHGGGWTKVINGDKK
jgi:hypothetical protein